MMRNFTILFLLAISFNLIAQSSSSSQKTLITKRTATWCPNCGTWGWDMAEGVKDLNIDDVVLVKAHHSGDLESQVAIDITNNWNAAYQPEFFINEEKQEVGSSNWSTKLQEFATVISENNKSDSNVSFNINSSISGSTITADVDVEFLKAVSGNYYLGIYLVEDSIMNTQSGLGSNTIHNGVLRAEFSGASFGSLIASGDTDSGATTTLSYSLDVSGNPVEDRFFQVLAIVWKKEGALYEVENIHEAKAGLSASVKSNALNNSNLSVINVGSELEVSFPLLESFSSGRIDAFLMNGQKIISKKFIPTLNQNFVSIPKSELEGQFIVVTVIADEKLLGSVKVYLK